MGHVSFSRGLICRCGEEERKRQKALEQLQQEEKQRMKREKLEEEQSLRDKLVKNVQSLEQRKLDIQRELLLRTHTSDGGHLKSAVTVPHSKT